MAEPTSRVEQMVKGSGQRYRDRDGCLRAIGSCTPVCEQRLPPDEHRRPVKSFCGISGPTTDIVGRGAGGPVSRVTDNWRKVRGVMKPVGTKNRKVAVMEIAAGGIPTLMEKEIPGEITDFPFMELDVLGRLDSCFTPYLIDLIADRQCIDYPLDDGVVGLVIPEAKQTISKLIASNEYLNLYETLSLIYSMAKGVKLLHDNLFLHRDIKPGNFLVSDDSHVAIITDFGISARLFGKGEVLHTTHRPGTEGYRAPEILSGDPVYSFSSDAYALGVSILMLLSRRGGRYSKVIDDFDFLRRQYTFTNPDLKQRIDFAKMSADRILGWYADYALDRLIDYRGDDKIDKTGTGKLALAVAIAGLLSPDPATRTTLEVLLDQEIFRAARLPPYRPVPLWNDDSAHFVSPDYRCSNSMEWLGLLSEAHELVKMKFMGEREDVDAVMPDVVLSDVDTSSEKDVSMGDPSSSQETAARLLMAVGQAEREDLTPEEETELRRLRGIIQQIPDFIELPGRFVLLVGDLYQRIMARTSNFETQSPEETALIASITSRQVAFFSILAIASTCLGSFAEEHVRALLEANPGEFTHPTHLDQFIEMCLIAGFAFEDLTVLSAAEDSKALVALALLALRDDYMTFRSAPQNHIAKMKAVMAWPQLIRGSVRDVHLSDILAQTSLMAQ